MFSSLFSSIFPASSSSSSSASSNGKHARQKSKGNSASRARAIGLTDEFEIPHNSSLHGHFSSVSLAPSASYPPSRSSSPAPDNELLPSSSKSSSYPLSRNGRNGGYSDHPLQISHSMSSEGEHRHRRSTSGDEEDYIGSSVYPPRAHASTLDSSINQLNYPSLSTTWSRLASVLASHYPELSDSLNPPTTIALLNDLERKLGMPLPSSVRESYLCVDGQDVDSGFSGEGLGMFFGLCLLPIEEILREWVFWRRAEDDPRSFGLNQQRLDEHMGSLPPKWIKKAYSRRGWLPLISDRAGNYLGVDLDPAQNGSWGQVIIFGRDFDTKCVLWRGEGEGGWGRWLQTFLEDVEAIAEATDEETGSNNSEDDIGYSSYFYDGGGGGGGDAYGDSSSGGGLRLTGHYKSWNVLEAWWDRSVRLWDAAGALDTIATPTAAPAELPVEAESAAAAAVDVVGKGKGKEVEGLGLGNIGTPSSPAERVVNLPIITPQPPTPKASQVSFTENDDVPPLPSASNGHQPILGIHTKSLSSSTEGSQDHSLLSPLNGSRRSLESQSPQQQQQRKMSQLEHPPVPLDLPIRADVITDLAVHKAEEGKLRGGWVLSGIVSPTRVSESERYADDGAIGMVDVDLEGGLGQAFGRSPLPSQTSDLVDQSGEEVVLSAPTSPSLSAPGSGTNSPFGLGRRSSPLHSPSMTPHSFSNQSLANTIPLPMSLPPTPPPVAPSTAPVPNKLPPASLLSAPNTPPSSTEADENTEEQQQNTIRVISGGAGLADGEFESVDMSDPPTSTQQFPGSSKKKGVFKKK